MKLRCKTCETWYLADANILPEDGGVEKGHICHFHPGVFRHGISVHSSRGGEFSIPASVFHCVCRVQSRSGVPPKIYAWLGWPRHVVMLQQAACVIARMRQRDSSRGRQSNNQGAPPVEEPA
eukprot:1819886-Rhodomonas_salina.1